VGDPGHPQCAAAGLLRPIIEALLAKDPTDRLTVEQTTTALQILPPDQPEPEQRSDC
jgi:hypothetical protein